MSKSSIPTDWHNCATCRHWTGTAIPNAFCLCHPADSGRRDGSKLLVLFLHNFIWGTPIFYATDYVLLPYIVLKIESPLLLHNYDYVN